MLTSREADPFAQEVAFSLPNALAPFDDQLLTSVKAVARTGAL